MQEHNVPVDISVLLYSSNSHHANFFKALYQCSQAANYKDRSEQMPAKMKVFGNKTIEVRMENVICEE